MAPRTGFGLGPGARELLAHGEGLNVEVRVCREDELAPGTIRTVALGSDGDGRPIQAILLRDTSGAIVAYRNLCRHLPIPLDAGTGELLSGDGSHLVCATHGATYRVEDGFCVEGPCEGRALHPMRVRVEAGDLYVSV